LVGKSPQLVQVAALGGEFDQLLGRGGIAVAGESSQFGDVD